MDLLKSFGVFQKVAELRSFSRAAESLGVVPSAVSRQITELENWAGLRLISRTTRSLNLTAEGQIYLERLSQISAEVQDLKTLGETERDLSGHINLTAPMMLGQFILPRALARFKRAHPKVEISVTLINRMVDIVEEGFDVAIRAGQMPDSSLMSRKVGQVNLRTVASPEYLEQHGVPEHPKDLSHHKCLTGASPSHFRRWSFRLDGKETEVKVRGDMSSNDSLCLKALALSGLGIVRLPHYYVGKELEQLELVEILPEYAPEPTPINIVHNSGRQNRPTLRSFLKFLANDLRGQSITFDDTAS